MITIFDRTENFPNKVNFVDEHNNLIGFDMDQSCCEDFGWFITDTELNNDKGGGKFVLEDYHFDARSLKINRYDDDEGGEIIIKLIGKRTDNKSGYPRYIYLHLFNNHNGYYSHGFELKIDNERIVCSI